MSDYTEHLISLAGGDGEPDLNAIQARADAATEGPWHVDDEEQTVRAKEYAGEIVYDRSAEHSSEWAKFKPTADFIAHARTDVPALLALVRSQQAQIERVRELHQPFTHHFLTPPAGSLEVCHSCRESYPCPTIDALTATEAS